LVNVDTVDTRNLGKFGQENLGDFDDLPSGYVKIAIENGHL